MPKINQSKIIVIVGPTASGKSDLGIKLAKKFNGEVISADSRQIYRGMDIGTGKVKKDSITKQVLSIKGKKKGLEYYSKGVRHYLIDVVSPKKQFTADDFKKLGGKAIQRIQIQNKIPIIVGGTGFYIDILLGRMQAAEVPPNPKLRTKLEKLSIEKLFQKLEILDPKRASTIDRYNKRRLIRALEIVLTTGKSSLHTRYKVLDTKYNILWLGLNPGKEKLAKKIQKRLDARLKLGMIKEVKKLHKQGVNWKRLDGFGLEYRWISRYLQGLISKEEMKENLCRDIIKYSKRQMTWFKRNKEILWLSSRGEAEKLTKKFIYS